MTKQTLDQAFDFCLGGKHFACQTYQLLSWERQADSDEPETELQPGAPARRTDPPSREQQPATPAAAGSAPQRADQAVA